MEISDYYGKMQKAELSDFLSRPVLIDTLTWTGATTAGTLNFFKPFYEFFNNSYIKYKLNNYSFLRCKLHLKILINASPFHYGAMLISYSPYETLNPVTTYSSADAEMKVMQKSQLPHLWIFPQNNQGGELILPFVWPLDWIPIGGSAGANNLADLGTIYYDVVKVLLSANGSLSSSDHITIQTYAWAEDVDVSGPTVALALQGPEWDEGVVSKPASWISSVSSRLTDIPVIGKFARAISIGSGAVSNIAKLFGFTDVPVIENVSGVNIKTIPDFSTSEISYPINRLCLDPKNELSIDPGIVGADRYDQLTISYLTQHESYIGSSTWSISDAVDTLLFATEVGPNINRHMTHPVGGDVIMQTPCGFTSYLFKYWRGDIIFKFVVVSSKFHKGRLRFTFDPTGNATDNILTTTNSSTVTYTQIVDLSDQTEFEVRVPYHQALPFLQVGDNDWNTTAYNSVPSFDTGLNQYYNGYVTLRVLTGLTAPVDTSNCSILVFMRAGENFELAMPMGNAASEEGGSVISYFEPQGSKYEKSKDPLDDSYDGGSPYNIPGLTKDGYHPRRNQITTTDYEQDISMRKFKNRVHNSEGTLEVQNESCEIPVTMSGNVASGDLPQRYVVNFGEKILSLRQLLHRKVAYRVFASTEVASTVIRSQITLNKHPSLFAYTSYGIDKVRNTADTADTSCVLACRNPIAYLAPAYIGYRGSLNYYLTPLYISTNLDGTWTMALKNKNSNSSQYESLETTTQTTSAVGNVIKFNNLLRYQNDNAGTALCQPSTQGALTANVPCFTNYKFKSTEPRTNFYFDTGHNNINDVMALQLQYYKSFGVKMHVSAGPDYSLNYFRCVPMLYRFACPQPSLT